MHRNIDPAKVREKYIRRKSKQLLQKLHLIESDRSEAEPEEESEEMDGEIKVIPAVTVAATDDRGKLQLPVAGKLMAWECGTAKFCFANHEH